MLAALKIYLKIILVPLVYFSGIIVMFLSIIKEALWGFVLLVFLIPQPNIWYKFHDYPFGKDFMDFLYIAVVLGIVVQKKGFAKTDNSLAIIFFIIVSYLALWNSSLRFSLPLPVTLSNELLFAWKNYAQMICLYFLTLNIVKSEDKQKVIVVLITVVVLLIAIRNFRNFDVGDVFNWDKRAGGPFEVVKLGANHFGAFMAYYCAVFLGLFFFDNNKKRKLLYLLTYIVGLHPLFFAFSRGAYLAAFGALTFMGVLKKRSLLLVVAVLIITWQALLPASVVDRITMTQSAEGELEGSASRRFVMWQYAMDSFKQNPLIGIGFGGFGFIVPEDERLTDTHNFFVKTLTEQGIFGILLLLGIIFKSFRSGWQLFRDGNTPFHKGLGFGFLGCVIAILIANMFGDRFSYYVLGGYFWVFWGLVDRGILISRESVKDG